MARMDPDNETLMDTEEKTDKGREKVSFCKTHQSKFPWSNFTNFVLSIDTMMEVSCGHNSCQWIERTTGQS